MLQYLKIKNLALLEEVVLEFSSGFTAVTGETGAGKSVLLGALGLLSGARTDKTLIRQSADLLEVEAALYFEDFSEIDCLLAKTGLPACEEGVLLLQRSIDRKKMSRIVINGKMATLAQLQSLGESWIDFHGPGEPQKLFQERKQLAMLDLYAGNEGHLKRYGILFKDWIEALKEIKELESEQRLDEDEIDFIRKQVAKIEAVNVSEESIETLERDFSRIASAQDLSRILSDCSNSLQADSEVIGKLNQTVGLFESLVDLGGGEEGQVLLDRVQSALVELQDLGEEVSGMARDFDFDPVTIESVTERMNLWQEVKRRFGGSVKAVIARRDELIQKLQIQGDIDGILGEKQKVASEMERELRQEALNLKKRREKSARKLADKAALLLQMLGFKKAELSLEIISETKLHEYGDSRCCFLFAPNAGQNPMPLNKIASSGETARVMLALKTVLAEIDATPLLVFDEVDANVGGEVGRAVGAELARLAGGHQVLCVTHLPQVAALASSHFLVTKDQDDVSTTVSIVPIHEDSTVRLEELARMLGDRKSASALAHAEELLAGEAK